MLHGSVCHRTSAQHKSRNNIKRKQKKEAMYGPPLYKPQMQQDDFEPQMKEDDFEPQMKEDDFEPQMKEDDFEPQIMEGDFEPQMKEDDFLSPR